MYTMQEHRDAPPRRNVSQLPSYDVKIIAGRRVIIYHDPPQQQQQQQQQQPVPQQQFPQTEDNRQGIGGNNNYNPYNNAYNTGGGLADGGGYGQQNQPYMTG